MKNKFILPILMIAMLLMFTGCSGNNKSESQLKKDLMTNGLNINDEKQTLSAGVTPMKLLTIYDLKITKQEIKEEYKKHLVYVTIKCGTEMSEISGNFIVIYDIADNGSEKFNVSIAESKPDIKPFTTEMPNNELEIIENENGVNVNLHVTHSEYINNQLIIEATKIAKEPDGSEKKYDMKYTLIFIAPPFATQQTDFRWVNAVEPEILKEY